MSIDCVISYHGDYELRRHLVAATVDSVIGQVDRVIVSASGLPPLLWHEHVTMLYHLQQRSQFEHLTQAAKASGADWILIMDDDDVASSKLVDTWRQRSLETPWLPKRVENELELQRDPTVSFDQLVESPHARVRELDELSGMIVQRTRFLEWVHTQSDVTYAQLDGRFLISMNPVVDTLPLVWQRRWRHQAEMPAWKKTSIAFDPRGPLVAVCIDLHRDLFRLLKTLCDMLNAHGIVYWIDSGTVLGALRHDNAFVPWDDDADVGIWERDINRLEKMMQGNNEFALIQTKPGIWKFCVRGDGYPFVDILPVHNTLCLDGFYHYTCQELQHEVYCRRHLEILSSLTLYGHDFAAPNDSESLMTLRYGPQWRTHAVCFGTHGDRVYGRLPMAARRYSNGEWVRVETLE